jgi:hypothetical protein
MANQELTGLDDYEIFLIEKMIPWSPQQRVALAAAIAEHWLPAYESFSADEDWGDPASLLRSLDAVWNHVQGRVLAETDVMRRIQKDSLPWSDEVRSAIEMCLQNNSQMKGVDAGSVETPHAYSPSMRRLWLEERRAGQSDADGWKQIRAWASHRPAVWEVEDRRKKKGLSHTAPELGDKLVRPLSWRSTGEPIYPWAVEVDGKSWRIRINDFPDELMYSLMIGGENAGDFHFHDWPETWRRSDD